MVLAKQDIIDLVKKNQLRIEPFDPKNVHASGIDLRISNKIFRLRQKDVVLDTHSPFDLRQYYEEASVESFVINPGEYILSSTLEEVELPPYLAGLVLLRSTYARLGLLLSVGVVSPGFKGQLTLELTGGPFPVRIRAEDAIFCMVFLKMTSRTDCYNGRYRNQKGPTIPILRVPEIGDCQP